MSEEPVWKKARKKPVVIEYREVVGDKEEIETREGKLYGYAGQDFIIRGVDGEIYPIKKDIFSKTYSAEEVRPGISFDFQNQSLIHVLLHGKEVGRIFTPGGTSHDIQNAIQVCGFEDAFDYWGCGVYGERTPQKIVWKQVPPESPFYKMSAEEKNQWLELIGEGASKIEGETLFLREVKNTFKAKKDIGLLFTPFKNEEPDSWRRPECWGCYSEPCRCDNVRDSSVCPYSPKRASAVGARLTSEEKTQDEMAKNV